MTEKELVLKAIMDGEYEVEIEGPNNVRYHERYDGTPFYVMVGNDIKFGVCAGSCTVTVRGHKFTNEFDYGEWSGDDLLDDDDIVEALEGADRVICGEHLELDAQWEVYAAANNITEDIPYFWYEDDEKFKAVDHLDCYDEEVSYQYALPGSDDWIEKETRVYCSDIYDVYLSLNKSQPEKLESGKEIILSGEEIKEASKDLYDAFMEDVACYEADTEGVRIRIAVSKNFFDYVL